MQPFKFFPSFYSVTLLLILFSSCSKQEIKTYQNYEVVDLPDGSQILLNYNTKVRYEKQFNPRIVTLTGEAFFLVAPGDDRFVVTSAAGEVIALGTEFNVKAEGEKLEVEVDEGIVNMNAGKDSKQLKRGMRGEYDHASNKVQTGKAEFSFRYWIHSLKQEFKALGKEIKHGTRELGKEFREGSKEVGKELNKEAKNLLK